MSTDVDVVPFFVLGSVRLLTNLQQESHHGKSHQGSRSLHLRFYSKNRNPQRKQIPLKVRDKRTAERHKVDLESQYVLCELDP